MLTTLSLIAVFVCSIFLVISHILHKIELYPLTKGILCFIMLSTVGAATKSIHNFGDIATDGVMVALACFVIWQTLVGYKRGYL